MKLNRVSFIAATALASVVAAATVSADILDIEYLATVTLNELVQGPYENVAFGADVSIKFQIDTAANQGGGNFHFYPTENWSITIDGIEMTASAVPFFFFSTPSTFHGFDTTSTGFLEPGGGATHNYRLPVFTASAPPVVWLPTGSTPEQHIGFTPPDAFDFFGQNAIIDQAGGKQGEDVGLFFLFQGMNIGGPPPVCDEDLNDDGVINVLDLLLVLNNWGPCEDCVADVNGDNVVNVADLLAVLQGWGPC